MTDMIETLDRRSPKDRPKKIWTGEYKGIRYEINNWKEGYDKSELGYGGLINDMWTYYITINLERIKDTDQAELLWLELEDSSISDRKFYPAMNITTDTGIWFHGECTYYEKASGLERDKRMIKIGCDYGHHMDSPPGINRTLKDVKHTIDSFYDWVGTYLRRCTGCGTYFEPGTGIENDAGWEYKCGGEKEYCN